MKYNRKLTVFAFVILSVLVSIAAVMMQSAAESGSEGGPLGSWMAQVTTSDQGSFPALLTFSSDGSVIADESPLEYESTGHGSWIMGDDGQVQLTFVSLLGSDSGANTGMIKFIGAMQFDAAASSWNGPFRVEVYDDTGAVVFSDDGMFALTQIAVEQLD